MYKNIFIKQIQTIVFNIENTPTMEMRMHTRGIEPRSQAWKACMMPLHYVCCETLQSIGTVIAQLAARRSHNPQFVSSINITSWCPLFVSNLSEPTYGLQMGTFIEHQLAWSSACSIGMIIDQQCDRSSASSIISLLAHPHLPIALANLGHCPVETLALSFFMSLFVLACLRLLMSIGRGQALNIFINNMHTQHIQNYV